MFYFLLSTMKTVDDHCGYSLPWDPLQKIFWNNAGYHDVHHQSWGIKVRHFQFSLLIQQKKADVAGLCQTNYSQPFLICWDRWLGTQWTGGDVSARYAASRERAAAAMEADKLLPAQKDNITNSLNGSVNGKTTGAAANGTINGNVKPRVPNGISAQQAEAGRRQVGADVLQEEMSEEERAEREVEAVRRSKRINGRAR